MDTTLPIKLSSSTSLEEALAQWKELAALNESLTRQVQEYSELSNKMHAENVALKERIASQETFYRGHIAEITDNRDRYKSRCIALITRLAGIKEAIEAAARDARAEEMDQPDPPKDNRPLEQNVDPEALKAIVSGLPRNELG